MSSSDRIDHLMSETDRLQRLATPSAPAEEDDADVDTDADGTTFRDIHPSPLPAPLRQPSWDVASQRSLSSYSDEQFMSSMGREFTAMVDAGGAARAADPCPGDSGRAASNNDLQLARIGEHEHVPETNPLAIVADTGRPLPVPVPPAPASSSCAPAQEVVEVRQVKKEEAEAKVAAWQAEEMAKINSKFKREEVVINGWENQRIHTATARLSKIERKLEEERAKATEKAQNEVARARRKAEEKRATAEAARGTKTARVLELANLMKAVGRAPRQRSFFSFSSS